MCPLGEDPAPPGQGAAVTHAVLEGLMVPLQVSGLRDRRGDGGQRPAGVTSRGHRLPRGRSHGGQRARCVMQVWLLSVCTFNISFL